MKNHVLVIGNMKRFIVFMLLYTLIIAGIVSAIFLFHYHASVDPSTLPRLLSLSESNMLFI